MADNAHAAPHKKHPCRCIGQTCASVSAACCTRCVSMRAGKAAGQIASSHTLGERAGERGDGPHSHTGGESALLRLRRGAGKRTARKGQKAGHVE